MNNLGIFYQFIEKNYELMKKYYLMAIENEHNYELMKKYYFMAIDNGNNDAIYSLEKYYDEISNE